MGFDAGDRRSVASVAFASDPDIISFDDYSLSSTPMTSTPSGKLDFVLSDWREPIVTIEKDNTHFEALPRIPLAAASIVAPSPGLDGPSATLRNQLPSNVRQVQACARLVHFSRSGNLLFSAGHVDGSVYVREIETRTGFIASAGDFLGHRHRVVSIASDFISGSNTDVVASCDSFGQVLVWTVSQSINPTTGKSYIISRRPQRMFRCPASQNTCLDISWQMGIVAVACRDSVRVFSVEREQLLHNISVSSLFFPSEIADDLISPTRNERSNTFSFATDTLGLGRSRSGSIALKSATVGSRSESPIRPSLTEDLENRSLSVDGMFKFDSTLDEGAPLDATKSEATSAPASAFRTRSQTNASITSIPNLDFDIDGADADAFDLSESRLSILHVTLCNDGIIILHVKFRKDDNTVGDALVSISLSGYLTGRVVLPGKLSYIDCASRGDVVLTGFEDGRVSLFTSQELRPLYSFLPWQDAACVYATYPTAISLVPTGATVLCVRVGPNEAAPAVLCVSTTMGELYVKPLPDFIRWERGRTPSALAQIVNAPLQAVRGTIQQATSLGAWTTEQANALAHNAKSFADETLSEMVCIFLYLFSLFQPFSYFLTFFVIAE